jgi:hypothetical protein
VHCTMKDQPLDRPIMAIWRMASAPKASIERSHVAADFHLA